MPQIISKPARRRLVAAFSLLSFGAASAGAGDTQLAPITVTAQRGSETTSVSADRIEAEQAVSLQDLFKQTPEVSIGGGGLPAAQKLYVRGLGERMLAVSIDGAAQAEAAYHHAGQVMIEPDLLKRVEMEAGTAAVTAGPGALAGALRFTTKGALDLLRPGERAGALVKASYFDASDGAKTGVSVFGRIGNASAIVLSHTQYNSGDYKDGRRALVAHTASDSRSRFVKFTTGTGAHQLALAWEDNLDEGLRNKRTNLVAAGINGPQRQKMERASATVNYRYAPGGRLVDLQVSAYDNENAALLGVDSPQGEHDGTRTRGADVLNVSRVAGHKLSYGVNYRHDTGFANVAGVALDDEKASVAGVFLHDDLALGEHWAVGLGARYDRYRYTGMEGRRYASSAASPGASLTWMSGEALSIRLGHARALRGVGVIEPFLKALQENAPDLQPEKAANTDLAMQWRRGAWFANATLFSQKIDNYIGYDSMRENLGQVRTRGYSADAGVEAPHWRASIGMAHARPRLNGRPLSSGDAFLLGNASGRTWVVQIDRAFPMRHLKLGWTTRAIERLDHVPSGSASKPGYAIHDAYASWLLTGDERLSVTLTINNLADKFYYDHSSFGFHPRWGSVAALPEIGRNVRLTLASRF
ncbi:TonB-dependent receptor [Massilia sp. PAMC28688]|uniref:TonB-dependent receptor domain-containing protein n=1 Tax=Massilia sp. PAMC28688 TaxID=2861283 RepID=UPI001C62FBE9|nr:TonB-dependent receptor [Massilia sp. PAMC28688]QYF95654.1 TonB-dependent receptor [Massilia sp. PAMC28688]